ncbi:integrase catalytic domain-containing protein [Trichonephila clavipes]|nr:integrase catalytic domain-containing protein [Trichonephila clavipes]
MRKDCKANVQSCHKCHIVNQRTANAYGLLQQLPIPSTPWDIVSTDPRSSINHTSHSLVSSKKYGITQSTTPPYSPQANSIVERANGIIVATLKKAIDTNSNKWDELLPKTLLAINTKKQNSTRKSPFYLLHGYEPRLHRELHELHIGSFIDDTPREDQLDLLTLASA